MNLENYIRDINDFPKPGILFKDITPLLINPKATAYCLEKLLELVGEQKIDKVVGIESRGFFFATLLAQKLQAGFVPIRKPGKLPYKTIQRSYALEYGSDHIEMHFDAIKKGDRILLHDDVLATGGTAKAACELIEDLGGIIVQCNFLMQLNFLKGKEKIAAYEVKSVLSY
ncbi:MAG: adenine phosphoribosyltransferase [Bacteroidetes bacterium HGW-Bacteroidetes-2]|jgi:adenine phosphoribosyltransferase|nr:MAG: adenine phosphoribosyltransferase [Bacteroidetes bacterium HGW-Bacteroidetes-2]